MIFEKFGLGTGFFDICEHSWGHFIIFSAVWDDGENVIFLWFLRL